jgi:alcohol dehydrogenase class IV
VRFEFATAGRIIFGAGAINQIGSETARWGARVLLVSGTTQVGRVKKLLMAEGLQVETLEVRAEPSVELVREGVALARAFKAEAVLGLGGGSALDAAKAVSAMLANPGDIMDYLEVIGGGKTLREKPLPCLAVPTTAGTGAEVTRNAVILSKAHKVKASLRSPLMLPVLALVDPELTLSLPPQATASTGMDALCQCWEAFISNAANTLTDGICREGLGLAGRSLLTAFRQGGDLEARTDMAAASLCGGLGLANARLGAVHGLAAPLGGMFEAPHGFVCAALLAPVMDANFKALREREPANPALAKMREAARLLTGDSLAKPEQGVKWAAWLRREFSVPSLSAFGVKRRHFAELVEKASNASSMQGNPVKLTAKELKSILEKSL